MTGGWTADGLDRRQQEGVSLRRRLRLTHAVRTLLQRTRIDLDELHGISPVRG
jgi:hypothetical protein